ncbi:alpha-glucan family phosphorylase [Bdellovibrionota bacterium FG-2]
MKTPRNLFEVSWEVANMVGGIHTVLASKVNRMHQYYDDLYVTIGPDIPRAPGSVPVFKEEIWNAEFMETLSSLPIGCKMGRWLVPGEPRCILVNFESLHASRDQFLARYWEQYHLHSLYGGWDYLEPVFFAQAAGIVVENLFNKHMKPKGEAAVIHCHEWMAAAAILHLRTAAPEVGTVFTTHATMLGRALSANRRDEDFSKPGDPEKMNQLAHEIGVSSKHSMENIAARIADCFTTVSSVTSEECVHILNRKPDMLLLNALGDEFQDEKLAQPTVVKKIRNRLFDLAEWTTGDKYNRESTRFLMTAGRYEFRNKGVDVFIDSLAELNTRLKSEPGKKVIAFLMLPAGHLGPKPELLQAASGNPVSHAPFHATHIIRDKVRDPVFQALAGKQLFNQPSDSVHIVFIPIYLDGNDPLIKERYYEFLAAADLSVFPSFYEPWGYTPMESIAFGVPTITSDLAGFGHWAKDTGGWEKTGVGVLKRKNVPAEETVKELTDYLYKFVVLTPPKTRAKLSEAALALSHQARWKFWGKSYFKSHEIALTKASQRTGKPTLEPARERGLALTAATQKFDPNTRLRNFVVLNQLPEELEKLRSLSKNVWWSWHPEVTELFSKMDPELWVRTGYNPSVFLDYAKTETLEKATNSKSFTDKVESLHERLEARLAKVKTPEIAFFCAEFGLTSCLKLYSGGLGILAGDLLKTASDLNLPLCAVGLAYHMGYFRQNLTREGRQEAIFEKSDFHSQPMQLVTHDNGQPVVVSIPFPLRPVYARAWKIAVGRINLYVLDTDFGANRPEDRSITNNLYGGDHEHRLRQEFVLGIGGLKFLKAINVSPKIFHMNEGHSAFLVLARIVELMSDRNLRYDEALEYVRHTSIFTTHTPVEAGHDKFTEEVIRPYLSPFAESLHRSWPTIMNLGNPKSTGTSTDFSMTHLCLRGSIRVNGVSEIHGRVSRKMFKNFFPGVHDFEVPVTSITNGVHVPTWIAPEWRKVFTKHLGTKWASQLSDKAVWEKVKDLEPKLIWDTHVQAKSRLITWLKQHIDVTYRNRREDPDHLALAQANLDQDPLIIGFARRFAPYKRAALLFHNMKKLEELLNMGKPVVFLFAGKAHPADGLGQGLIQRVIEISRQPGFQGKVIFAENYDLSVAQLMVAGCDVWLNTPTRPLEASGTSGMKAGVNGCLNLSVSDGWWTESYNGKNGWIIADEEQEYPADFQNEYDSARIYAILEHEVFPLFFDRNEEGVPVDWVEMMKESIATIVPGFSSARMLEDYNRRLYQPAVEDADFYGANDFKELRALSNYRIRLQKAWESVTFTDIRVDGLEKEKVLVNQPIRVEVEISHPQLNAEDIHIQTVLGKAFPGHTPKEFQRVTMKPLTLDEKVQPDGTSTWYAEITCPESGPHALGIRIVPKYDRGAHREMESSLNLVKWL